MNLIKEKKIQELAKILMAEKNNKLGLMLGEAGVVLSLYYYLETYASYDLDIQLNNRLDKLLESVKNAELNHSYSNGITGIGWVISHLSNNKFIDINQDEALNELDLYLLLLLDKAHNDNHDFLHGYLGIGYYFLERRKLKGIEKAIDKITLVAKNQENGMFWTSKSPYTGEKIINLGLAHGVSSIISFLSKVSFSGYLNHKTNPLISASVNYILSTSFDKKRYHSFFPSTIHFNPNHEIKNSRLAWCYGDLGIAISLFNANLVLKNSSLEKTIKDIITSSLNRKNYESTAVIDSSFCHGSAGVSYIYKFFYKYFEEKNSSFKDAADFWLNVTLSNANKKNAYAGYMSFYGATGWKKELGILEGIAGIMLVLLSDVNKNNNWQSVFLI